MGLSHKGDIVHFVETKDGPRFEFIAASGHRPGDNFDLYTDLQHEGKPIHPWLETWKDIHGGRPPVHAVLHRAAESIPDRPAQNPAAILETPVAGTGGKSVQELLSSAEVRQHFTDSFNADDFEHQQTTIENMRASIHALEEHTGEAHPSVGDQYESALKGSRELLSQLETQPSYRTHLGAWQVFERTFRGKVPGLTGDELHAIMDKWTVHRFLDAAKEIAKNDFRPHTDIERVLQADRLGVKEIAGQIISKGGGGPATRYQSLGSFFKSSLS